MNRFRLVLLLLLLLPHPAAASGAVVQVGVDRVAPFDGGHPPDVPRAAVDGCALLVTLGDGNGDRGPLVSADLAPPEEARRGGRGFRLAGVASTSSEDSVAPLCERLPYHATAPPLPR